MTDAAINLGAVGPARIGGVLIGWQAFVYGQSKFFTRRCRAKRWVEMMLSKEPWE